MLNHLNSKFSYITFPFYGTYKVPTLHLGFNEIQGALYKSYSTIKLGSSQNYLEDLLNIELEAGKPRFKFNVTAQSVSELIMLPNRVIWGVDNIGRLHNLERYEEYPVLCTKLTKITKNKYMWFNGVSRPIETPLSIKNIEEDLLYYWYTFLYINQRWELYKVEPQHNPALTVWI